VIWSHPPESATWLNRRVECHDLGQLSYEEALYPLHYSCLVDPSGTSEPSLILGQPQAHRAGRDVHEVQIITRNPPRGCGGPVTGQVIGERRSTTSPKSIQ